MTEQQELLQEQRRTNQLLEKLLEKFDLESAVPPLQAFDPKREPTPLERVRVRDEARDFHENGVWPGSRKIRGRR